MLRANLNRSALLQRLANSRSFSATSCRDKQRLVILGSGWGGYEVLRGVDKKRWGKSFLSGLGSFRLYRFIDVILVSPNNYFNFTPLLAGCAVGTLEFRCAIEPVRFQELYLCQL